MDYESIITRSGSVFIDTAPIIYFIEAHEIFGPPVKQLMEIISKGEVFAYTSVITLAEVLPVPLRTRNKQLASQFSGFIKNSNMLHCCPSTLKLQKNPADYEQTIHRCKRLMQCNLQLP